MSARNTHTHVSCSPFWQAPLVLVSHARPAEHSVLLRLLTLPSSAQLSVGPQVVALSDASCGDLITVLASPHPWLAGRPWWRSRQAAIFPTMAGSGASMGASKCMGSPSPGEARFPGGLRQKCEAGAQPSPGEGHCSGSRLKGGLSPSPWATGLRPRVLRGSGSSIAACAPGDFQELLALCAQGWVQRQEAGRALQRRSNEVESQIHRPAHPPQTPHTPCHYHHRPGHYPSSGRARSRAHQPDREVRRCPSRTDGCSWRASRRS